MGCSKTDREERRVRQTARSFDGELEREESLGNKTLQAPVCTQKCTESPCRINALQVV